MTAGDFHVLRAEGITVTLDLRVGHVRQLRVDRDGRAFEPLHRAPWVDDPQVVGDATLPLHLRLLSGDFFCAPFAASDVEGTPTHGWSANDRWAIVEDRRTAFGATALYRLGRPVMGATVEKRFTLRDGHPFLYQTHTFVGGGGSLPVANHAMVRLPSGGRLTFSPKALIMTPNQAVEDDPARGRSHLAYPARSTDPTRFPTAGRGTTNLASYPIAQGHEDVVTLVEAEGASLGWLSASRPQEGDAFVSLKNSVDFPTTTLWFSNGGRDYSPWESRHTGVLGVEEARSYSTSGHSASVAPNDLSALGVSTALPLDPQARVAVRNVIGVLALPATGAAVCGITVENEGLRTTFDDGTQMSVPFDSDFLT